MINKIQLMQEELDITNSEKEEIEQGFALTLNA